MAYTAFLGRVGGIGLNIGLNRLGARTQFPGGTGSGGTAAGPLGRPATSFAQNAADFYGSPRPISFGRRALQGRHIWASDIRWKGDSGKVDFAVAFGEQGVPAAELARVDVLRLWANDQLILDKRSGVAVNINPNIKFTVYPGNFTQNPDPLISKGVGAAQAVAFRGTIYIVFRNFPLKKFGFNQIPFIRAELTDILTTTTELTEFTKFAATPQNLNLDSATVDWLRQRFHAFEDTGGGVWNVHTYSIASRTQIASATLGFTPQGISAGSQNVGYDPFFGQIMVTQAPTNNTRPIHVVDPLTGGTVATFGTASSSLTNDKNGFVSGKHFAVVALNGKGGATEYLLFVGSSLKDLAFLRYEPQNSDGSKRLRWTGYPGVKTVTNVTAVCAGEQVTSVTDPVGVAYASDAQFVYRVVVPAGQDFDTVNEIPLAEDATYTAIHDVGAGNTINRMWLDPDTGHLLITYKPTGLNERIKRIEATDVFSGDNLSGSSAELFDVELPAGTAINQFSTKFIEMSGASALFKDTSPDEWVVVNLQNGDFERFSANNWRLTGETVDRADGFTPQANVYWNSGAGFAIMTSQSGDPDVHISKGWPGRASELGITMSNALRWLALKSGLTAADLSIGAGIDDFITGVIVEQRVSYFDMVNNISNLYDFVVFESEGKIKMVRGAKNASYVPDFEVAEDDLCPLEPGSQDDSTASSLLAIRRSEQSMPTELECVFIDPTIDYSVNVVRAQRTKFPFSAVSGTNAATISVPIVITPSEALSRITEALYRAWNGQIQYVSRLGPKFLRAEPGDLIEVTHEGSVLFTQVVSATLNADLSVSVVADRYATEGEITLSQDDPLQDPDGIKSEFTELVVLDTNLINTSDDNPDALVMYVAAVGGTSNWLGGAAYTSLDGFSFQAGEQHDTDPDLRAVALTNLSATPWYLSMAQDWKNSVTGVTINGAISNFSSATHEQLVADDGLNLFAIGTTGRWEIVQAGTVVDDGNGLLTLSDLVRGLRGTELHMNDHAAGDTIISLGNRPPISRTLFPNDAFGDVATLLALPLNAVSLNDIPAVAVTLDGNAEKPFAPANPSAALSGSDIVIDWERRTRLHDGTVLIDGSGGTVDQPQLGEESELYDLDIYDAAGTAIVHSEVDLTTSTYTFTAAEITAAGFGATPTTLKVDVYQKSAVVGRGHRKQVTLDVI